MTELDNATELSESERYVLARDLNFYQVTEQHTWLKTEDDILAYIKHNFSDVYGDSLHAVKKGMDYTVYAWRTNAAMQRIRERWVDIKSWSRPDAPAELKDKVLRFRKPRCLDFDFGVWINGVYIGDVRRAHVPAFSPGYPCSGRHRKPAINGWEAMVEDPKAARFKQVWDGFRRTREEAAFQLFVCALEQAPFAVYPTNVKRGHV